MYEETADSYAQMMDTEIGLPVYADILGRLRDRIANIPGAVVDTACGSGHMLSMYHERYDSNRPLLGIDLSPRMVSIAGEKLGPNAQNCRRRHARPVRSWFRIKQRGPKFLCTAPPRFRGC